MQNHMVLGVLWYHIELNCFVDGEMTGCGDCPSVVRE